MTLAYCLSAALAVLLFVAAVGGLFVPGLYRDTPLWAAQASGFLIPPGRQYQAVIR